MSSIYKFLRTKIASTSAGVETPVSPRLDVTALKSSEGVL